jgi:galactokinase
MDQAVSLNAIKNKVSVINFNPLTLSQLDLPEGIKIAVFSSLKDSRKATGDCNFYNTRVAECRAGCAILRKLKLGECPIKVMMCFDLQKLYQKSSPSGMLEIVESLPKKITLKELSTKLGVEYENLLKELFSTSSGQILLKNCDENTELTIQSRLRHVYSEAFRAQMFERILRTQTGLEEDRLTTLSQLEELLNDSHKSCDLDYECSCKELNVVIEEAKKQGCFCARLTGAGMGGFAVGLVHT